MINRYNNDVIYLCKLPSKEILEKEFGKIVNDDVIITKERIKHIEERRKDDADYVKIHMLDTIQNYDYLIKGKDGCVQFIKEIDSHDNLIVIWLSLNDMTKANSIMSGIRIRKKELIRLLKNNIVLNIS